MIGVAIGTMALIVVLSVFNGLQDLIRSLYNSFDPDIKIEAASGKSFILTDSLKEEIRAVEGVDLITEVIEDNALITYRDKQVVARLKGVDDADQLQKKLDDFMVTGEVTLTKENINYAILGFDVAYQLSALTDNDFYAMQVIYPKKIRPGAAIPRNYLRRKNLMPGGVFSIEKEYNQNYVFVPLRFAQELMDYGNKRTALEIQIKNGETVDAVQEKLQEKLGADFRILDSDQQHSGLLRALQIEKLFVFITFSFILAIASFNIFFSLSMLAIEKKKDIAVLFSLGATKKLIKSIFLKEGAVIALTGTSIGLLFGLAICLLQQEYGFISMGIQTSVVTAYPIKLNAFDFLFVFLSIGLITLSVSYRPALLASRVTMAANLS